MKHDISSHSLFTVRDGFLAELFSRGRYPWEIVADIEGYISRLLDEGIDGYSLLCTDVLVGENVRIHPSAVIEGRAVIGSGCEIRPGAYLRGDVLLGSGCVIGNSTELKRCVLLSGVQAPHYNYIGDSVLGDRAHLGAGVICSNLRSDKRPVSVRNGNERIETGMRKLGAMIGDSAEIGCGCVINPGTVIGRRAVAYPLTSLRGTYPAYSVIR